MGGLEDDGHLIINTTQNKTKFNEIFKGNIWHVDASKISIEEIGKHIPNVPMLGALLKAFYLVSETEFADALGKWLSKTLPLNNVEANLKAFTQGFQTANKVK